MNYQEFIKLDKKDQINKLAKLNLFYDLDTKKGQTALKKEFKYIQDLI